MSYANTELRGLAARATPLDERWQSGIVSDTTDSQVDVRLRQWQQVLSVDDDPDVLARRLALDGLDRKACRAGLGIVRFADDHALPDWFERFNALLQRGLLQESTKAVAQPSLASDQSLPFKEIWMPWVQGATEELRGRAGKSLGNVSDDALRSFQERLLASLAHLASLPLGLEFGLFVADLNPLSIFRRSTPNSLPPSRDLYDRFIVHLRDVGMFAFFQEYAVLARLMTAVVDHWVDRVAEFCRRLDDDRPALATRFNQDQDLGPVVAIQLGLSDPHQRGRSVIIPTFASGLKIVYKSKDLGIDEAYSALIDWLMERGCPLSLQIPKVLNRSTHGWVEFVDHLPCQDAEEVERYYRGVGMLLCLAYVLGGTDYHLENIIASGKRPVLVDLETMLQPLPRPWDAQQGNSADQRAAEIMHDSVLRTGLLPFWMIASPGKSFDMSGIGAEEQQDTGYLQPYFEAINTDRMLLQYRSVPADPLAHRPVLNDQAVSAREHAPEMVDGFAAVYRFLIDQRDELLACKGPLSWFDGLKLRYVFRPTQVYALITNRLLHPEFLRDGADRSIEIERLVRPLLANRFDPERSFWEIYRAEVCALERLDIPFFSFLSDKDKLLADGKTVASEFFTQRGVDYIASRIRSISEEDLRVQTDFIRACLHTRFAARPSDNGHNPSVRNEVHELAGLSIVPDNGRPTETTPPPVEPLKRAELIAGAMDIAEQIRRSAIRGADGGTTWFSLSFDPTTERMNLLPMTDNLYDGRLGVTLFLAALERVTGGAGFRDLALAALLPLRTALRQQAPPVASWNALGGASGLGSQLYALVRIAVWLGDAELLELAQRVAGWFTRKRIERDQALDVIGGAAGGILGLLALAEQVNGEALQPAERCGEHLLQKRVTTDVGPRSWRPSWSTRPLTGFGHGAAGIAYALLRLSQATGDERFRNAAIEGIAYETASYSAAERNWPDFRDQPDGAGPSYMSAWCHGATGIGLARLGGLVHLDNLLIHQDIDRALLATRAVPLTDADHLCCGNMGRIDFLLEAGKRLERPDLFVEARQCASTVVRRAAKSGNFQLYAHAPGLSTNPAFFQGISGIGYSLLRLAEPERLPCALLWE